MKINLGDLKKTDSFLSQNANLTVSTEDTRNRVFKAKMTKLVQFTDTKIRRHVMVKLDKNAFLDRNYFLDRLD